MNTTQAIQSSMKKRAGGKIKHIGFSGAQERVESEGYGKKAAGAIIASAARKASGAAKKANPALKKVKGSSKY